jgi:hypothetical protein
MNGRVVVSEKILKVEVKPSLSRFSVVTAPSVSKVIGIQGPAGASGQGTTELLTRVAGENLGGHRVVIVDSDNKVYYADRTNLAHMYKVVGITRGAANVGDSVEIQTYGLMTELSWNWIAGQPIFLGTNGLLTQVPPSYGFCLIIAKALTSTDIFISVKNPIILGG